jgi:hypothetical protein
MHLSPRLAAKSVQAVHLRRKFSPGLKEIVSPANALYQKFKEMGLSANMAHDYTTRVHPPKFKSGKFESLPKRAKPLLPSVFMRKGNSIRGIAGGVKRG